MLDKILKDLDKRMDGYVDSRQPTKDEVSIAWLLTEIGRLNEESPKPNGSVDVNYDDVDPWKFLENLAVNITILKSSYNISLMKDPKYGLADYVKKQINGCDEAIALINRLGKLIEKIHI